MCSGLQLLDRWNTIVREMEECVSQVTEEAFRCFIACFGPSNFPDSFSLFSPLQFCCSLCAFFLLRSFSFALLPPGVFFNFSLPPPSPSPFYSPLLFLPRPVLFFFACGIYVIHSFLFSSEFAFQQELKYLKHYFPLELFLICRVRTLTWRELKALNDWK